MLNRICWHNLPGFRIIGSNSLSDWVGNVNKLILILENKADQRTHAYAKAYVYEERTSENVKWQRLRRVATAMAEHVTMWKNIHEMPP